MHENLQLVSNPSSSPRQIYEVQSLKNYQNRHIYMNEKAQHYLEMQREHSHYTALDDYVCCTRDGNHVAVAYLSNNIKEIERSAGTKVTAHGTHVIRHTCASLYFRKGVRVELIGIVLKYAAALTFILWRNRRKPQWNCWMILILDKYFAVCVMQDGQMALYIGGRCYLVSFYQQ